MGSGRGYHILLPVGRVENICYVQIRVISFIGLRDIHIKLIRGRGH